MGLSSRDTASLIWLGVLLVVVLSLPGTRVHVFSIGKQLRNWKIWLPLLVMGGLSAAYCALAAQVRLWDADLVYPTLSWYVTTVVVLLFAIRKTHAGEKVIKKAIMNSIKIAVLLQLLVNLFPLDLGGELLLVPVIVFLALLSAVASQKPETQPVATGANILLSLLSLGFAVSALWNIATTYDGGDFADLARNLGMPVWLTLGIAPAMYLFYLLTAYEVAFSRGAIDRLSRLQRLKARVARFTTGGHRPSTVARTPKWVTKQAAEAVGVRQARKAFQEHEATVKERTKEGEDAQQYLIDMAGVLGQDERGYQLDRREFAETVKALTWLGSVQMGQHRKVGRYRDDALQIIGDFAGQGLPGDHGIRMTVSRDGRRWWAYRRTITGWVFAIGSAQGPPDQWQYDGPERPSGFPGEAPEWGAQPFASDAARNWSSGAGV